MPTNENRVDVLLVYLRDWPLPIPTVSTACLVSWVRRDPELKAVSFATVDFDTHGVIEEMARQILARDPRLVGFSCFVWNYGATLALIRRLKELAPSLRVLLGGPEVAEVAERELERRRDVDFICCGEGEETLRQLARCLFRGDIELGRVEGLAYRAGDKVCRTKAAELVDLKESVSPYLTGLVDAQGVEFGIVETSRGCPFTCSYCDWGPRTMRLIPDARLEAEFAHLAQRTNCIHPTDADLTMNKTRGLNTFKMFLRATAGTPCQLSFQVNPLFLVPEIIDLIATAPEKFGVCCGIQSINEEVLARVERTFDRVKIERNLTYLRANSPKTPILFSTIYGLPGDDRQSLRETMDWCLRWRPAVLSLHHALVLPGTELEKKAAEFGLTFQPEAPHQVLSTDKMSREDIGSAREFAMYFKILEFIPDAYNELMGAAADHERPLGYISIIEEWVEAVKANSIRLPGSEDWKTPDNRLEVAVYGETFARMRGNRLLMTSLVHIARQVGERRRASAEPATKRV